jgi:putative FmdB family regulatory protein
MPIYEYVCETCGNEFEVMQKFSDAELKKHDCAPKAKVRRKLSLTAFHLQGGGWYASGYGNHAPDKAGSNGKSVSAASKGESSKSESSGSAKSESGGASKSESSSSSKSESSGSAKGESSGASKSETKASAASG